MKSGDFHYGEMEIKRREYGWPGRVLSPEFVYWALSGYGTAYGRALFALGSMVLGFGALYRLASPGAFADSLEALRLSLSVAALQRPDVPAAFGSLGRWLYVCEAIVGPVQIALFALALRMRLRR